MRLFVAINFSKDVKNALLAAIDELKGQAVSGNFTSPDNLHLTLAFIGESERASAIRGAIDPALIAMMRKMPAGSPHSPSPESEARWAAAASHPDAEDLAKAKSFMQGFLAMYDKFLKMM